METPTDHFVRNLTRRHRVVVLNMVRIHGLDCPLDVFRKPNEIEISDFDSICQRAVTRADGTLLPDPLDLIQSKFDTGRDKDLHDILFLESVVRTDYKKRLPTASLEDAETMLGRYPSGRSSSPRWKVRRRQSANSR
jgi:hypothetical protein